MPTFTYKALPHQLAVLNSNHPEVFLGCGVGAGKTDVGTVWGLRNALAMGPKGLGLICANTYSQLIFSTLRSVYRRASEWGIELKPDHLPRSIRPLTLEVNTPNGWVTVLCRSLEHWEDLAGLEVAWAWVDEAWQTSPEAIDVLRARLRDKASAKLQILMTTTLDAPGTWMHRMAETELDPRMLDVIYAPTHANQVNLPPDYVSRLQARYDDRSFRRYVLAQWVTLVEHNIYYSYSGSSKNGNVDPKLEISPRKPLLWAHDFNIGANKPMSSVLCQVSDGISPQGIQRKGLVCLDEIVIDTSNTQEVIAEFKQRGYGEHPGGVVVYGDASGYARDTRGTMTDYMLLSSAGFIAQNVPRTNPPVRERHNAVNTMLCSAIGDRRIKVHPRCKTLLAGLESARLKDGTRYIEDDTNRSQHVTTALGYLVCQEFPLAGRREPVRAKFWK